MWYVRDEMTRHRKTARPGTAERFEQPKVLVRDTGAGLECTLDDRDYYVKDVLILASRCKDRAELLYLTGILNSCLMRFYYETSFPTLHVQRDELASLPYRPVHASMASDVAGCKRVGQLVGQMISLHESLASARSDQARGVIQRQIDATGAAIDRLVYELYGLTDEEILLVEGTKA